MGTLGGLDGCGESGGGGRGDGGGGGGGSGDGCGGRLGEREVGNLGGLGEGVLLDDLILFFNCNPSTSEDDSSVRWGGE